MGGIRGRYLLLFLMFQSTSQAQSFPAADIEPGNVSWRILSFRADSSFGKLKTDVQLTIAPARETAELLTAAPQHEALLASGSNTVSVRVHSSADPLLGSREELETRSWFNPEDISALGEAIPERLFITSLQGVPNPFRQPCDRQRALWTIRRS